MSYTPGPWEARDWDDDMPFPVGPPLAVYRMGGTAKTDRIVNMVGQGDGRYDPDVTWANARLIAAAPDLLAALEAIENLEPEWGAEMNEARDIAHAAIAKARTQA